MIFSQRLAAMSAFSNIQYPKMKYKLKSF